MACIVQIVLSSLSKCTMLKLLPIGTNPTIPPFILILFISVGFGVYTGMVRDEFNPVPKATLLSI